MKLLSLKNSSVFFSLLGVMLLTLGFNGFMAHTYSTSTEEIDGVKLVKTGDLQDELGKNGKVCIASPIYSDDLFDMPDNHQKVIKGKLTISAIWPDGSQTVLVNWSKQGNYIRISDSDSTTGKAIAPKTIECGVDTAMVSQNLRITRGANNAVVEYFHYSFTLNGCIAKGQPKIAIQRETLSNGENVAVTISQNGANAKPEIVNVVPYKTALNREKLVSKSKAFYLAIGIIGILMLFIPEQKAQNTIINNIKNIGNKILSK